RAGEEIRMMEALPGERVGERLDDVLLADQLTEIPGAPLAGENLGHTRRELSRVSREENGSYSTATARGVAGARLEVGLHPDLGEVDPVVGVLDARVREMLVAVREVVLALRAEAVADSEMIAELKRRAEPLRAERGRR